MSGWRTIESAPEGIQFLLGLCLCLTGFYFFIDALENSRRFTPSAGISRVFFCCLSIFGGGLMAALPFLAL